MAYTVLARRYRPQTFDQVIGQEPVARTLRNAITSDRVAHAYLFTGTRGVGKTTMARLLAKALNCEKGPTPDPCGKCESCRRTQEGDDIDVIEIDGASNTGVDNVRELRAGAIYAPARSRFKIYIIDEVHMLSTGAFNALLKTLEEPPEHVKFIFATTDPQKVPGTIHSRCQRFDFRAVPTDTIADYLAKLCKKEKVNAEPDALRVIAREGRGSVRDALTILDQAITLCGGDIQLGPVLESLGLADSERYFQMADAVAAGDVSESLRLLDAALAEGAECGEVLDHLLDHLRALLLVRTVGPEAPGLEVTKEERAKLVEQAARFTEDALAVGLELVGDTRYKARNVIHNRPLVELAMVQLARMPDFASIRETLARLDAGVAVAPGEESESAGGAGGGASARPARGGAQGGEKKKTPPLTAGETGRRAEGDLSPGRAEPRPEVTPEDGGPADRNGRAPDGDVRPMTRAEQEAVRNDPTVRRVLELFGGRIVGMRPATGQEEA